MDKKIKQEKKSENLIAIIRITGQVKVRKDVYEALFRLRIRRKYSCVVLRDSKELQGIIKKIKFFVAYGVINKETFVKLLKSRGKSLDKKEFNPEKIAEELIKGKKLQELNIKPFFRLHPPRKGINSKLQYPKGVLGDNKKDINKLIERML